MNSRDKVKTEFVHALMDRTKHQIMFIQADAGLGKSHLLKDLIREAKQLDVKATAIYVDFFHLRYRSTNGLVGNLKRKLGADCFEGLKLVSTQVHQRFYNKVVLFFDTYEKLHGNSLSKSWIEDYLLDQLKYLPNVLVVIAGRKVPSIKPKYKKYSVRFKLKTLNRKEIKAFLVTNNKVSSPDVELIADASRGNPLLLSLIADSLEKGLVDSEHLATITKDPAAIEAYIIAQVILQTSQENDLSKKLREMVVLNGRFLDKEFMLRDEVRKFFFIKKDAAPPNKEIMLHDEMQKLIERYLSELSDDDLDQIVADIVNKLRSSNKLPSPKP